MQLYWSGNEAPEGAKLIERDPAPYFTGCTIEVETPIDVGRAYQLVNERRAELMAGQAR